MKSLKQLLLFQGETLVQRTIRVALEADFSEVAVVIGAASSQVRESIGERPVRVIENSQWEEGLASSLRMGIAALSESDGVMILLVDQPQVTSSWLGSLLTIFESSDLDVVATSKGGIACPPAIVAKSLFEKVATLRGDEGAKKFFSSSKVQYIEFPGDLSDVDTAEDYKRITDATI